MRLKASDGYEKSDKRQQLNVFAKNTKDLIKPIFYIAFKSKRIGGSLLHSMEQKYIYTCLLYDVH